jgi:hypothetical protein
MRRGCGHVWLADDSSLILSPIVILFLSSFLAVMAWNIDYEYDSEEVILLKKHIAEQGSSGRAVHIKVHIP